MQRGVLLALAISVPIGVALAFTRQALVLLGQDPHLASEAARYAAVQIPSVPCFLVFMAVRQWLQGREIVRPAMWLMLVANVFNVAANYVLIFGAFGLPGFGLVGAGAASALTRVFTMLGLIAWVRAFGLHVGAWSAPGRHLFDGRELGKIVWIGSAVAIQLGLEIWAFSATTLLAGLLDPVSLAAHTIAINLAALSFMMPLGVSQGAAVRVGNLIGAGEPDRAQRAAAVAMTLGGAVMVVSAVLFVALRWSVPRVFTEDPAAIAACAAVLPIAAAFQIFDGVQVVGCGVLRGMGHTRPAAIFNFVGYWVVGLPLGAMLALHLGYGLPGIWWGLATGLLLVAGSLAGYIARRGPAHARRI
jgi:MATE family multidrug resistance protein